MFADFYARTADNLMLTYYDHRLGRSRLKRRYQWAVGAFVFGVWLAPHLGMLAHH